MLSAANRSANPRRTVGQFWEMDQNGIFPAVRSTEERFYGTTGRVTKKRERLGNADHSRMKVEEMVRLHFLKVYFSLVRSFFHIQYSNEYIYTQQTKTQTHTHTTYSVSRR